MKKIFICLFAGPALLTAQIPVTDVAANAQLVILTQTVVALNTQMATMNATMQTLLALSQQNVAANINTSQLTTQDIVAKRTAPAILLTSPEMTNLIDLKNRILDVYKGTRKNIDGYGFLRPDEIEDAYGQLSVILTKVSTLVAQATSIATTPDLIEPGLRMSTITNVVEQLNSLLDDVTDINVGLNQRNMNRKTINTLIETN